MYTKIYLPAERNSYTGHELVQDGSFRARTATCVAESPDADVTLRNVINTGICGNSIQSKMHCTDLFKINAMHYKSSFVNDVNRLEAN